MKNELKSAIIVGIVVIGIIASVGWYFNSLEQGEKNNVVIDEGKQQNNSQLKPIIDKTDLKKAPDLIGISGYINTTPEELKEAMKDKVVLYDFWTYSCINCLRTLPYIVDWNSKYSDKGLLIIGVHSPEFEFEKDYKNVQTAVKQFGILYPVVQDNDMKTWKAFDNRYWPRKYITDSEGYIRYDHIGEGGYAETEKVIQQLLEERGQLLGLNINATESIVNSIEPQFSGSQTPELYFGYNFAFGRNYLGNSEGFKPDQTVNYSFPEKFSQDHFYLEGQWQNLEDRMKLVSESGKIVLPYNAKSVNIVASKDSELQILVDDKPVSPQMEGIDVTDGIAKISSDRLYNLISADQPGNHKLTIIARGDLEIYTFTFG